MTFQLNGGRPGDQRGFIHKRILGAAGGFLTGGVGGAVSGFIRPPSRGEQARANGTRLVPTIIGNVGGCPAGMQWNVLRGRCETITEDARCSQLRRGSTADQAEWQRTCGVAAQVGMAVMGQYGAALQPGSMMIDRAVCLRGMHLGNDGLCYNKSQITNKQRMWPAGRKPLLSGGDMRAISIAARAGRRMELATKRLQRMGMMKKPARRLAPHKHARAASNVVSV